MVGWSTQKDNRCWPMPPKFWAIEMLRSELHLPYLQSLRAQKKPVLLELTIQHLLSTIWCIFHKKTMMIPPYRSWLHPKGSAFGEGFNMLLQPYLVTASERMGIFCAKKGCRASPSPSVVDLLDTALDADGNFPLTCRGSEQPCGRYR